MVVFKIRMWNVFPTSSTLAIICSWGRAGYRPSRERSLNLFAVLRHPGSIFFGHERKLRIHVDNRPHLDGAVDYAQHLADHFHLVGIGFDRFDAGGALQRVRRVYDHDPVAMTEQWHHLPQPGLPIWRGLLRDGDQAGHQEQRRDQNCSRHGVTSLRLMRTPTKEYKAIPQ